MSDNLLKTPLSQIWEDMGARMVEFAGYSMPVQFKDGVIKEHLWTRENAGLFDVSHMGPCVFELNEKAGLSFEDAHIEIAKIVEKVLPADVQGLKRGQIRYSMILNENGGIIDDLMVARPFEDEKQGSLYIVVNAGGKEKDFEIFNGLGNAKIKRLDENALVALQGPKAKETIGIISEEAKNLKFMHYGVFKTSFGECFISRSGYTGEDGFEILIPKENAKAATEALLANENIKPIGLGARDSLRLEAGLSLYGHDLDETISPIEADLAWTIQKTRRERGDFLGAARILSELKNGASKSRIGISLKDKAPAREGTIIADENGNEIGIVTSGGFSPSKSMPIAMGYVTKAYSNQGTKLNLIVRGKAREAEVVALPFVSHNYHR